MSTKFDDLEKLALELSTEERALLAEHLIASLDTLQDANFEDIWAREAEDRYQAYKSGLIKSRDATDVMQSARDRLK